ncbi:MAG: hypothetical protein WEC59_01265 [Salibacteraceae bacterium]
MKRLFFILISAAITLSGCNSSESQKAEQKAAADSLLQVQQDSLLDVFLSELEGISRTIDDVSIRNGILNLDSTEGSQLSKNRIIEKVNALDQRLLKNQAELDNLVKRMRERNVKNKELEKLINSMQSRIADRETEVEELKIMLSNKDLMIEEIKTRLDTMRRENISLAEDLIGMDEEMHLVYYIIGEQKELQDMGIVTKEGGIFGIGAAKKMDVSSIDKSMFTESDQRELQSIPLFSKKAKLITDHPDQAYTFQMDENGQVQNLLIEDRKSFWKAGDYLIIEVSN